MATCEKVQLVFGCLSATVYTSFTPEKKNLNLPVNTATVELKCSFHQQEYSAFKAQCVKL